jgi:hypothetical protein
MQPDIEDQAVVGSAENEMIGPAFGTLGLEMILLENVVDRDVFFLLDLGRMPSDALAQLDADDTERRVRCRCDDRLLVWRIRSSQVLGQCFGRISDSKPH